MGGINVEIYGTVIIMDGNGWKKILRYGSPVQKELDDFRVEVPAWLTE